MWQYLWLLMLLFDNIINKYSELKYRVTITWIHRYKISDVNCIDFTFFRLTEGGYYGST